MMHLCQMPGLTNCVFRAILQAYLPLQADKEWLRLCEELVWPPFFSRGWTEAVHLYNLGGALTTHTDLDALHVKCLNVPSWARFLQILEDAGPEWVVAVLYRPAAQNITTRDTLNNLLKANDPGGAVPVSGGLDTLAHENVKC
jgi:hypothetical protein